MNISIAMNTIYFADKHPKTKSTTSNSFRNRSFKPPSPLFVHETYEEGSGGKVINEILYRHHVIFGNNRSRRTSNPISSSELNELEQPKMNTEKLK